MQNPPNLRELRTAEREPLPERVSFQAESATLTLGDIYFTLFRHKLKIILCALLGLSAAYGFYKTNKRIYQSEAKLFVRYVMESRTPGQSDENGSVKSPDPGGLTILNSELEIITSLDLAGKVVDAVGVEKFLPPLNDGNDRDRAVFIVSSGLHAFVPPRSSVVQLMFSHTDASIVQPVLREVINSYLKKHLEIHRSAGLVDDFLTQETERLRSRLAQTEDDLRKAQTRLGFASLSDAKKSHADLSARLRGDIYAAEMELAERSAFIRTLDTSAKSSPTDEAGPTVVPSDEVIYAYSNAVARLELLRKAEQELLGQFTPENNRVKETRAQLAEADAMKRKLEQENPSLSVLHAQPVTGGGRAPAADLMVEMARAKALQSKIVALNEQLTKLKNEKANADQMEAEIVELNRRKDLEESNYRKYAASLEQARLDEAMSSGHVSNISEIQSPSLPLKAKSKRPKTMLLLAASGVMLGLGWAFAIELFFDRTVRRPIEIERKLNIPLLLTVPVVNRAFIRRLGKKNRSEKTAGSDADKQLAKKESAADKTGRALQQYHATLRDRLIQYFDNQNLVHKPKLIAVTGLSKNAGVTTTAAGLAQSLSETGEGNVLLVDMTAEQGSAQQYFKGKAISGLEEMLQTRDRAPVQENLYVVTEGSISDRLSRNLPQRFTKLIPKLKTSDFDYIIFDMPSVSQISITPRLAGLMDVVLLVIESERTDRELVQRATTLLTDSKAHVCAVLNKTKTYVPPSLYQDSLTNG